MAKAYLGQILFPEILTKRVSPNVALMVFVFCLSGCSYSHPVTISPMTLGPKEHPITTIKGESTASYFFGFLLDGEDTLAGAIDDAKNKAGLKLGTMVNVFVDQKQFCVPSCWFGIYRDVTTTVYGTLISYDFESPPAGSKMDPEKKPNHEPPTGSPGVM